MRTAPYVDFSARLQEAILLVRSAKDSNDAEFAAACSKSAAVLVAAALERYINDALNHACRALKVESWDELPAGVQKFLVTQIARHLRDASEGIGEPSDVKPTDEKRMRAAVVAAEEAFAKPSTWSHLPQFGVFMDGAAAPDRLNAVLRSFRADRKELFQCLEGKGLDRGRFGRALTDLVDSRHTAAHAIPGRPCPSPNDVAAWVAITFRIVREVEVYLSESGSAESTPN